MRDRQSAAVKILLVVAAVVWPLLWGAIGLLASLIPDGEGPSPLRSSRWPRPGRWGLER